MNESPVHGELRQYVDANFNGQDQSFRDVLFSLAYSEYCFEKKKRISRRSPNGAGVNPDDVANVVRELQHQEEYRRFCANAEKEIGVLGQRFSEATLATISGVVVDSLNPKFNEISHLVKQSGHKGFFGFLKSSMLHAFEIVVAVIILKFVYEIMVRVAPIVGEIAQKYLGQFFSFWGP